MKVQEGVCSKCDANPLVIFLYNKCRYIEQVYFLTRALT